MFVFDTLKITNWCIHICSWYIDPPCTALATGLAATYLPHDMWQLLMFSGIKNCAPIPVPSAAVNRHVTLYGLL